jgi:hypothetical protein
MSGHRASDEFFAPYGVAVDPIENALEFQIFG